MAFELFQVDVPDANRQTLRDISKKTKELIKDGYDNFKELAQTEINDALDNEVDSMTQETLTYVKTNPEAAKSYKQLLDLVKTDPEYQAPK